jgi:hypothetical protein
MARKSKYDPEFHPTDLVARMSQGQTNEQVMAAWKVSDTCFYAWKNEYKELKDAYEEGLVAYKAKFWDRFSEAMDNGEAKKFNYFKYMGEVKCGYKTGNGINITTNTYNQSVNLEQKSTKDLVDYCRVQLEFLKRNNITIDKEAIEVPFLELKDDDSTDTSEPSGTP